MILDRLQLYFLHLPRPKELTVDKTQHIVGYGYSFYDPQNLVLLLGLKQFLGVMCNERIIILIGT